jgi:hypothetical protein
MDKQFSTMLRYQRRIQEEVTKAGKDHLRVELHVAS